MSSMISLGARKSLFLIAIAAIGMSAFQLAGAQTTAGPTASSYPSESSYPTDSPTISSYPSESPVATTDEPTNAVVVTPAPTTRSPTTPPAPLFTVQVSIKVCPTDCALLEANARLASFLEFMAACFLPFNAFFSRLVGLIGTCSSCSGGVRERMLQGGAGGAELLFEFGTDDPNFTDEAAAQAFADNLAGLPDVAAALQPGLTIDPASVTVGSIVVQSLTGAPTMSPTKTPKDNKKKKDKKDKKKKDKKEKKKKVKTGGDDSTAPPKKDKVAKKAKKEKKDKGDKTDKKDKKEKR